MLHGIYGAGRNWSSIARRVKPSGPTGAWSGRPEGTAGRASAASHAGAAAGDLRVLAESTGRRTTRSWAIRSGQGRAAYARDFPDVRQLWIDSTPAACRRAGRGDAGDRARPIRDAAVALVKERVRRDEWMATNVEARGDTAAPRLRRDGAMLQDFARTDLWRVVEAPTAGLELHPPRDAPAVLTPEAAARSRRPAVGPGGSIAPRRRRTLAQRGQPGRGRRAAGRGARRRALRRHCRVNRRSGSERHGGPSAVVDPSGAAP